MRVEESPHPSDLRLDAFHLKELPAQQAEYLEEHLASCSPCTERLALRRPEGLPSLDMGEMLTKLKRASEEASVSESRISWFQKYSVPLAALAAACAVILLFSVKQGAEGPSNEGPMHKAPVDSIRAKGAAVRLRVFREEGKGGIERSSGDVFREGDRIRFRVEAPEHWNLLVLGVEKTGVQSTYYPPESGGDTQAAVPTLGPKGTLAGAIELDDYLGSEWIYLVACPEVFSVRDLSVKVDGQAPATPPGCHWTSFEIVKAK